MRDDNEIVIIEMVHRNRLILLNQITAQIERTELTWDTLDLGFELPAEWPIDVKAQPTISQLIVLAKKLKMRVVIADLNMVPANYERPGDGE